MQLPGLLSAEFHFVEPSNSQYILIEGVSHDATLPFCALVT